VSEFNGRVAAVALAVTAAFVALPELL